MSTQDDLTKIRGQIADINLRLNNVRAIVTSGGVLTASRLVRTNAAGQLASNAALTAGYIPYANGAGSLANSPFYTDGTSVGLGTIVFDALFNVLNANYPVGKFIRSTAGILNDTRSAFCLQHRTTGDMVDGFGAQFSIEIRDSAGANNIIAGLGAVRDGADNSGKISFDVYNAGVQAKGVLTIDKTGLVYMLIPLTAPNGGTGQSAYAIGDLLYANTTASLARLADVVVGSYLRSGGAGVAPLWSTLKLPNAATKGDIFIASAANTMNVLADVAVNQVLCSGGIGTAPAYSASPTLEHLHLTDAPATGGALITAAESWIGPSDTAGIYFKGGAVGIGATSPHTQAKCQVAGNMMIGISGAGASISGYLGAGNDWYAMCPNSYVIPGVGWKYLKNGYAGIISFVDGNWEIDTTPLNSGGDDAVLGVIDSRLKILNAGNVLIGAAAAAYTEKLAVVGANGGIAGIYLNDATPSTTTATLYRSGNDLYWGAVKLN